MISRATALLLDVGDLAATAKRLRFLRNAELDVLEPEHLEKMARACRAAAYSARIAATRFETRAARRRHHEELGS